MKIIKTASGKKTIKLSKSEWQSIGKKAGWVKVASPSEEDLYAHEEGNRESREYDYGDAGEGGSAPFTAPDLIKDAFMKGFLPFGSVMKQETKDAAENIADTYGPSAQAFGSSDMNGACRELLSAIGLPEPSAEEMQSNRKVADMAFSMFQ